MMKQGLGRGKSQGQTKMSCIVIHGRARIALTMDDNIPSSGLRAVDHTPAALVRTWVTACHMGAAPSS